MSIVIIKWPTNCNKLKNCIDINQILNYLISMNKFSGYISNLSVLNIIVLVVVVGLLLVRDVIPED